MRFPQITSPPQAQAEVVVNEALETLEHQAVYGKNHETTTGLTWGYYGGRWGGFSIADGTLTLTNASTNYIVVAIATGVSTVSTSATNWSNGDDYVRVYKLTTAGSVVTATEDHRVGPGGVHGGGTSGTSSSSSSGVFRVETQISRAALSARADGTFRNPLVVGTGVLTAGSITTITDDTKYLSFPSVKRMHDGRLLTAYHRGDGHNADNTDHVVGKIGTEGLNGAITWGSEFVIYDPATAAIAVGLAVISTGRIFCTFSVRNFPADPLDGAYVSYSDDNAATWSTPININSTLTAYTYASGPVCELPNGDLLVTVEGLITAETYSRIRVLKSTDGGLTWGSEVDVDATQVRHGYEGQILVLDNDTILMMIRTTDGDGDIRTSTSTDGGATWSAPAVAFSGHGMPHTIQLSTGTLVCITRKNSTQALTSFTSIDRAATWSSAVDLDATMTESEYGCPVELFDERILVVYGTQPTGATTNADIKQIYVTEGKTTLAALDADLVTIAGLTATTDNFMQAKSSAWASRTPAQVAVDLQSTGLVADMVGYRTIPANSQSAAYTAVAADSGKSIDHPSTDANARTFTIPANSSVAYPVGTCLSFSNMTSQVVTIAITTDTLYLAGPGTTGSRSLAQYGTATARKLTSATWLISGVGLT